MMNRKVVVAGATGHLGGLVVKALSKHGAEIVAIVRPGTAEEKLTPLHAANVKIAEAGLKNDDQLRESMLGAGCVVSTLQGLREVIVDGQSALADAAIAAGVPRFIPSDFAVDLTKLPPGMNRNLELRREFHKRVESRPIQITAILNGAFDSVLMAPGVLLDFDKKKVHYWGDADQKMDFTTLENTADFTALAALDSTTPHILRIAGAVVSARDLAAVATEITGKEFALQRSGSLDELANAIVKVRQESKDESSVFPQWQQMQYMHNMFSGAGKLDPLDNERYTGIRWSGLREMFASSRRS